MKIKAKDDTLEALWKALPDYVSGDASTLVVRDGSGSMTVNVGNTDMTALVSGFNPTVYQMVFSDELDPYRCLLQQLNAKRYDAVEQALGEKRG